MNAREKYIQELEKYLVTLPAAERADAVDFYNEFIEDAHYDTREQIVAELGTPRQLSHQILADYSIKANEKDGGAGKPASTKSSWRVFWLVLIAIVTLANYPGPQRRSVCYPDYGLRGRHRDYHWPARRDRRAAGDGGSDAVPGLWPAGSGTDDRDLLPGNWPGSAGGLPDLYSVRLLDYPPVGTGNREPF